MAIASRRVHDPPKLSEEAFQSALEHAAVGTYVIDTDAHLIRANHTFSKMLGYSEAQLLKKNFCRITYPEDLETSTFYDRRLLAGEKQSFTFQKRLLHKSGKVIWVAVTASLVQYANRDKPDLLNFVQDLSSGKLASSETRFRRLFEAARDGIVVLDGDSGQITDVNPFVEELLGYPRDHFLRRQLWDIGLFEDVEACKQTFATLQRERYVRYEHLPLRHESGVPKEVEFVSNVYEVDGKRVIQCNIRDISTAKRASEALRESEECFRVTFDEAAVGIAQIAPDGHLVRVNQRYCDLLGYSAEELLLRGLQSITHPDDQAVDLGYLRRALAGGPHSYSMDKRYWKKDGTLFWVNVTNKLVTSSTGEPKYLISVIQDISVVQDISERKLLQEQLLQAQKMEAIGRLAGGVAHDFNNLLTVITGYCGMILRRLQDEDPIRHEIGEIKMAGERAAALTAKLLAFSRRQVPQRKVTDLTTVMIDVHELLMRLIGEDIQLIANVEPGVGLVNVDEAQIGQVIMNLAVNARDAMPRGGTLAIQLTNISLDEEYVRSHFGVWPGRYVALSVKDTGCGMDAETQARMFDPFFTTKEQGKGTGLGLSMVYGIVKEHGGHVDVDSVVGMGTTVRIYLPRVEGIAETSAKELGKGKQKRGSETILVVEDDDQLRQMVAHILQADGYTVLEAENGDQALLLSRGHVKPIDLVVTDIVMPGMSGRTLAEKITSSGICSRVLFMSGYSGDTTGTQEAMFSDVPMLIKPVSPEQLLGKVRLALETINNAETGP